MKLYAEEGKGVFTTRKNILGVFVNVMGTSTYPKKYINLSDRYGIKKHVPICSYDLSFFAP